MNFVKICLKTFFDNPAKFCFLTFIFYIQVTEFKTVSKNYVKVANHNLY